MALISIVSRQPQKSMLIATPRQFDKFSTCRDGRHPFERINHADPTSLFFFLERRLAPFVEGDPDARWCFPKGERSAAGRTGMVTAESHQGLIPNCYTRFIGNPRLVLPRQEQPSKTPFIFDPLSSRVARYYFPDTPNQWRMFILVSSSSIRSVEGALRDVVSVSRKIALP